uniref:NB-ARC domain-containing protein n=1 Tax=Salix viminalis TaxID=40686 RepID=A0A6N2MY03_SALVM
MPKGIERLTCLRTLDCFIVCGGGENESKAANLRELKNLDHIGGSLVINIPRGGGIEDAAEAQLKNKKRLLYLELNFCDNHEDGNLIEVLQPPSDLEGLAISSYGGIVLPNWMMALTRLQELQLRERGNLEVLPPLGRLPNLESLVLERVGVRRWFLRFCIPLSRKLLVPQRHSFSSHNIEMAGPRDNFFLRKKHRFVTVTNIFFSKLLSVQNQARHLKKEIIAREVQEEVNLVGDVKKQADKLKSNLIDIQSVLEDAERKQVKERAVRVWLDKLKDVCYDMDDVLDEWSYAILTWKTGDAEENIHNQQKIRCSFLGSPCFCLNQVVRRRDIALKIKEVSEKVDEIANERARHGLQINRATDEIQRPTSTQFFDESSVCGRDDEKKIVVSKLLADSSQEAQDVDVISLVGLGGIGKTTLAQLAFNDVEVKAHFEKKIWVCVSEAFDEVRIAKAILEKLEGSTPNLVELQSLLERVSQSIKGMRFLLVLDDVWTENHEHWEQLKRSLTGCARGSRILVTTRKATVATMMRTNHQINIETLSDDACRSIFNHLAFHKRGKDECERLTDIGNEIANKCKGLPLAAKVLGGLMQSKRTREEWEDVLCSELWRLDQVDKDQVEKKIFLPLLLSYYDLPSVVRRCFLYCAMFPKDYEMNKDELVKMWMAQGYLKGTGSRDMEVVGFKS